MALGFRSDNVFNDVLGIPGVAATQYILGFVTTTHSCICQRPNAVHGAAPMGATAVARVMNVAAVLGVGATITLLGKPAWGLGGLEDRG